MGPVVVLERTLFVLLLVFSSCWEQEKTKKRVRGKIIFDIKSNHKTSTIGLPVDLKYLYRAPD